jgi:hypothetical protein
MNNGCVAERLSPFQPFLGLFHIHLPVLSPVRHRRAARNLDGLGTKELKLVHTILLHAPRFQTCNLKLVS